MCRGRGICRLMESRPKREENQYDSNSQVPKQKKIEKLEKQQLNKLFDNKVCSLLEWSFIISIAVSNDHSQLRYTGFAGSH